MSKTNEILDRMQRIFSDYPMASFTKEEMASLIKALFLFPVEVLRSRGASDEDIIVAVADLITATAAKRKN